MKKSMRIALTVAVLASLASIAMADADPGGTVPQPLAVHQMPIFAAIIAAILSLLGL